MRQHKILHERFLIDRTWVTKKALKGMFRTSILCRNNFISFPTGRWERDKIDETMKIFSAVAISLLIMLTSCAKQPTEPGPAAPHGPRELQWSIDTVNYPGSYQTMMFAVWGSAANDVYIVGHNELGFGEMFHYDGSNWSPVSLSFGSFDLYGIYGFSAKDIWAVGKEIGGMSRHDTGLVLHFDGSVWKRYNVPRGSWFISVWGSSPSDVWFGGEDNVILHYYGSALVAVPLPPKNAQGIEVSNAMNSLAGDPNSGKPFAYLQSKVLKNDGGMTINRYLLQYVQGQWIQYDSMKTGVWRIWISPSSRFYVAGAGLQTGGPNSWIPLFEDDPTMTVSGIGGTSDDNLFICGYGFKGNATSYVFHFNGKDWYRFKETQLYNYIPYDLWTNGSEVFVVGYVTTVSGEKTLIMHGK
jgi:hypothetical protein